MLEECREYGLREPELIDAEGDFRINLYRNNAIDSAAMPYLTEKVPESAGECRIDIELLPEQQKKIYEYLISNGQITTVQVEALLEVKQRRAREILSDMIKANLIKKVGAAKNTKYRLS